MCYSVCMQVCLAHFMCDCYLRLVYLRVLSLVHLVLLMFPARERTRVVPLQTRIGTDLTLKMPMPEVREKSIKSSTCDVASVLVKK